MWVSILLMSTGSIHVPTAGFGGEGRKGLINDISSWIDFIKGAEENTVVQRP